MARKIKAAIVGPGNIGMDLMFKLMQSACLELGTVVGIIPDSGGLRLAARQGFKTTAAGVEAILDDRDIRIVFDCTSATGHRRHAPLLRAAGKIAVDLVAAIARTGTVHDAEIVATIASRSAGPGTRANIDEFTVRRRTGSSRWAARAAARPSSPDLEAITESVHEMVRAVQMYVPGYRLTLTLPPTLDGDCVTVMIEVEGDGAYLPKYAGNLDVMTAAARAVGEQFARTLSAN